VEGSDAETGAAALAGPEDLITTLNVSGDFAVAAVNCLT
jgi:hypothetical protein